MKNRKSQQRSGRYKGELSGYFKTEKCNSQNKKLNGWADWEHIGTEKQRMDK